MRWWAPQGAHLGPDAGDLLLLEPGEDPEKDLGNALLALHRVGAAACEVAATTPLVDESTLIGALVKAREQVAPAAVESVAKSLGDVAYADLLCRDVLDDAEAGALVLFRTAVSKGVPPPIAAQRCGMVYGVPYGQLGQYRALAIDPRANPVALTDAADRVLLEHVRKAVAVEDFKQDVSKAPVAVLDRIVTQDDPTTPYYDARTETGQFAPATTKLHEWIQQQAAEAPVKAEAPAKPKVRRISRIKRVQRAPAPAAQQVKTEQVKTRAVSAKPLTPTQVATQKRTQGNLPPDVFDPGVGPPPHLVPKPLREIDDPGPYDDLPGETLAITLPATHWGNFVAHGADGHVIGDKVFRMNVLEEYSAQKPLPFADHMEMVTSDQDQRVLYAADLLWQDDDYVSQEEPHVEVVPSGIMPAEGSRLYKLFGQEMREKTVREWLRAEHGGHPPHAAFEVDEEARFVREYPDLENPDDTVFVYSPPPVNTTPDQDAYYRRPPLTVVEALIEPDDARGIYVASQTRHGHAEFRLNPNAGWKVTAPNKQGDLFYDREHNILRRRVKLTAMSKEEVEDLEKKLKAEGKLEIYKALATLDDPATTYYDARDTGGRFTTTLEAAPPVAVPRYEFPTITRAPEKARVRRVNRVRRVQRTQDAQVQATTAQIGTQAVTAQSVRTKAPVSLGVSTVPITTKDGKTVPWHDQGRYDVFDIGTWAGIMNDLGRPHQNLWTDASKMTVKKDQVQLFYDPPEEVRSKYGFGPADVDNAMSAIQVYADAAASLARLSAEGKKEYERQMLDTPPVMNQEDMEKVEERVNDLFKRDPRMRQLDIEVYTDPQGIRRVVLLKPSAKIQAKVREQAVIDWHESIEDWDSDFDLQYVGEKKTMTPELVHQRMTDLWTDIEHGRIATGETFRIFNVPVKWYQATAPGQT